jgi:hypothetical protein
MKILLGCLIVLSLPLSAQVTCYAVTPSTSGSGTGASWTNAHGGLPTETRGVRYYLADGAYSTTSFSVAASGTTTIEIRKAQAYDYGRSSDGCSNDISAGWNASTMGASQATFGASNYSTFSTAYWVINGNGTSTLPGCGGGGALTASYNWMTEPPTPSDCGISFLHTNNDAIYIESGGNDVFEYVEIIGNQVNANQEVFGGSNDTFSHMYMRNSGCVFVQDLGSGDTIDHSYFWGTEVNGGAACHGQAEFEIGGTNNGIRSNNIYRDITGTAIWTFAASVGTNNNWTFYNNIVWYSPSGAVTTTNGSSGSCPSNCVTLSGTATAENSFILTSGMSIYLGSLASSTTAYTVGTVYSPSLLSVTTAPGSQSTNYFSVPFGGTSDAALDCINGNLCTNFTYVQNTVINCINAGAFGAKCGEAFSDGASGCSLVKENNFYFDNPQGMAFASCASMTLTEDYNSYINTSNFGSGSHDTAVSSGAANPFVNWPQNNFALTTDSSNFNNRVSLSTPTVDIFGNVFSTDRGAVQFEAAGAGGSSTGGSVSRGGGVVKQFDLLDLALVPSSFGLVRTRIF